MELLRKRIIMGVAGSAIVLGLIVSPVVASAQTTNTSANVSSQLNSVLVQLESVLTNLQGKLHDFGTPSQEVKSPAADLRVALNNLLRQHVAINIQVNRDIIDDAASLQASQDVEYANGMALASAIGSIYGEDAQKKFQDLFDSHLEASNDIAKAIKAGDTGAKQDAVNELQDYLHKIAAFLSGAIHGLDENTAYSVLWQHEQFVNESTQAYADGDYQKSYEIEQKGLDQVSIIADVLASGIVTTFPDKF